MSAKRLLVVATVPVDEAVVRDRVREHVEPDGEVRVVAPASDLSPLQWLATDEDEAREEAAEIAETAEQAVASERGGWRQRWATRTPCRRSRMRCASSRRTR